MTTLRCKANGNVCALFPMGEQGYLVPSPGYSPRYQNETLSTASFWHAKSRELGMK